MSFSERNSHRKYGILLYTALFLNAKNAAAASSFNPDDDKPSFGNIFRASDDELAAQRQEGKKTAKGLDE